MSVVDEMPASGSVDTLRASLEQVQADLQNLQKELQEALQSSRSAVESGQELLRAEFDLRQKTWDQQEADWQRDRNAYQQRIVELEEWFIKQLTVTEQNALRALNELDNAWQRDKQQWHFSAVGREKEARDREESLARENEQQRHRILQLEAVNAELQRAKTDSETQLAEQQRQVDTYVHSLQGELEGWKRDKEIWQQSLAGQLHELHQREEYWETERQKSDVLVQTLQQEISRLQRQLNEKEASATPTKEAVQTNIASLEAQIASLNDFIRQMFPIATHPMRRKTDVVPPRAPDFRAHP